MCNVIYFKKSNKWKEQSVDDVVKDLMREIEEQELLLTQQQAEESKKGYKKFMKWRLKHYTEKIEGQD